MGLGWLSPLMVELETMAGILICGAVNGAVEHEMGKCLGRTVKTLILG